jgi:hypothetical protein
MRLSAEASLMLLAVALYLYDALCLLASNEAVLVRGRSGRWFARFGAHRWRLGSKEPCLPNPFMPQRPMFRLAWSFEGDAPSRDVSRPLQVPSQVEGLGKFTVVSALCIFVLLPAGLFSAIGASFTVAAVALMYLNIVVALAVVHRRRAGLSLPGRQFAGLAFECLVCPPFSINLVRRLCARVSTNEPFTTAARRLLSADAMADVNAQCVARLEEQMDFESEGSQRMQTLQAAKARFAPPESP